LRRCRNRCNLYGDAMIMTRNRAIKRYNSVPETRISNESRMLMFVAGKSLGKRHIAKILDKGALSEGMHIINSRIGRLFHSHSRHLHHTKCPYIITIRRTRPRKRSIESSSVTKSQFITIARKSCVWISEKMQSNNAAQYRISSGETQPLIWPWLIDQSLLTNGKAAAVR
jgi:hypothetical protein